MNYHLIKDVVDLVESFESSNISNQYNNEIDGFKKWMMDNFCESHHQDNTTDNTTWEGKENGRSSDSVITTFLLHLNKYAKNYSKSAMIGSPFSTQEEFIYLINLKAFGCMSKMDLIKRNVHEKPVGMLIIHRLMSKGWVLQEKSTIDKRNMMISITPLGLSVLEKQMSLIRKATNIVSADLTNSEKMELIRLLKKMNDFHLKIYEKNYPTTMLLEEAATYKN